MSSNSGDASLPLDIVSGASWELPGPSGLQSEFLSVTHVRIAACQALLPVRSVKLRNIGPGLRILECGVCERTFTRHSVLAQHMRRHTGQRPYQCIVCGRAFTSNFNVKRHIASHRIWPHEAAAPVQGGQLQTQLIPQTLPASPSGGDLSSICPYCPKTLAAKAEKDSHIITQHSDEKRFQCPVRPCRLFFPSVSLLLAHLDEVVDPDSGKRHTEEREFQCPSCSLTFESLRECGLHQHTHALHASEQHSPSPDSPAFKKPARKRIKFECQTCGAGFKLLESLERHQSHSHQTSSFPCPECGKRLASERLLRRHVRGHGEARVPCPSCDLVFASLVQLKNHERVHGSAERFKCEHCRTGFRRAGDLRRHLGEHVDVKWTSREPGRGEPKCGLLSPPFPQLRSVHTDRASFHCTLEGCGKGFKRLDLLKAHSKRHGLEDVLVCPEKGCGKRFASTRTLGQHSDSVHKGKFPHLCKLCPKGFNRPDALRRHAKAHAQSSVQ